MTIMKHALAPLVVALLTVCIPAIVEAAAGSIREPDILPSPKVMTVTGERFLLSVEGKPKARIMLSRNDPKAIIAAREINDRIAALGGEPLPVAAAEGDAGSHVSGVNTIWMVVPKRQREGNIPDDVRNSVNSVSASDGQGYVIQFRKADSGQTVFLAGADWQGLLHAGSTFRLLIRKAGGTIFATEAQVKDWPDFKHRGLPVWPLPASFDDFREYVDWAYRYKFNRIYTDATVRRTADGFHLPVDEERHYLKSINAYAKERGILISYAFTWAVGAVGVPGRDGAYRGKVVFNDHYYSWSDDRLLQKRAAEIAQFAAETGTESLVFHCIDTHEEGWDRRSKGDRARFGDDRASADANVINTFTRELRRMNPAIELQFVAYPYHANFDLPGNGRYKAWLKKLTALIPNDVYLTVTEFNREQTDSWVATVRQPLLHWINGNAFQWGRYFSTLPAFSKTAYYPGRDRDTIIHWEPIGNFRGETMQLVAAEYAWNVESPGSGRIREEKTGVISTAPAGLRRRRETVDARDVALWAWYDGTREPAEAAGDILLKACRLEFGEPAAPFVAEFFRNNPVGWRSPELFGSVLHDVIQEDKPDACADQLVKVRRALESLKKGLQAENEGRTKSRLEVFLRNTYHQSLVITGETFSFKAMKLSAAGLNQEAPQELAQGRKELARIKGEMERQGIWSAEATAWYKVGSRSLATAEANLKKA